MLKFTIRAAALAGALALTTGAYAQGTITPPASATGQPSTGTGNTNGNGVAGTVAGSDNLRGNVGSAPNEAVGSDKSPVSGSNAQSNAQSPAAENRASNNTASAGSNQSSVASNSDKTFDPSSLNLGKTSTPIKGLKNKARVEANERRITQQLNRAAASMPAQNPG
jgi:hypothetical protein